VLAVVAGAFDAVANKEGVDDEAGAQEAGADSLLGASVLDFGTATELYEAIDFEGALDTDPLDACLLAATA